ncbi:MAG: bifunctional lysylphosphatidylglycerol flippase/synthetase MprF [Lactobacillales bacterium]|nr:bifunctional lysylphosphatidylglycerol flippase/synthetase MprF [Lactobacillales bacterium]
MIQWIKAHFKYFKYIFLMAVVLLVITELFGISKRLSGEELQDILASLPLWKPIVMILVGLIAILPMIGYDVVVNRLLDKKPKKMFLFETSWLINTMNNMIGFGGFFTIGLRSQIYGKDREPKKVINAISKIFLFSMSGLSVFSLISLILVLTGQVNSFVSQYWMWLVGGALYFPIVLIVTTVRKEGLLGGLTLKEKGELLLYSFLEWFGVLLTFIIIGLLLGVKLPPLEIGALFIAAMIIGIASMIPGALGSFDVMMFLGLARLGVNAELVGAWLLLFRVAYYFVPFILGAILAVKNLGGAFNERYHGVPRALASEIAHKLSSLLLFLSGILLVLSATIPEAFDELKWLRKISPWSEHIAAEFPKVILGFLLIAVGRAMANQVKRAYYPALILLVVTLIYRLTQGFSWYGALFLALLIILTIFTKEELYREQLVFSLEALVRDGFMYFALVFLYVGIGIYNSPYMMAHHPHRRLYSFLFFPSDRIWFTGLIAIIVVLAVDYLFIRYLEGSRHQVGEPVDDKRVYHVLETYGGNTESQLIFLKDKDMYMYQNKAGEDTVFFQFKTYHDKVIVMGSPAGKEEDFSDAIHQFIEECDLWGYSPVFYEVKERETLYLHEYGYSFIKMGEEGHVDLVNFSLSGKKHRGNRAIVNKFQREGYVMEMIEPPFAKEQLVVLREISDEWLGGRREKGFSLGYFDEEYISRAPIGIVKNTEGEIVAFATIMPSYSDEVVTVDLMRYSSKAPSGVMDFLFISLFEYWQAQGVKSFDLGMAPLSNVGMHRQSFIQERLANMVYQFGSKIYSFQGLRSYKDKYANSWIPRYTLYPRNNSILFVFIALIVIDNKPIDLKN